MTLEPSLDAITAELSTLNETMQSSEMHLASIAACLNRFCDLHETNLLMREELRLSEIKRENENRLATICTSLTGSYDEYRLKIGKPIDIIVVPLKPAIPKPVTKPKTVSDAFICYNDWCKARYGVSQ